MPSSSNCKSKIKVCYLDFTGAVFCRRRWSSFVPLPLSSAVLCSVCGNGVERSRGRFTGDCAVVAGIISECLPSLTNEMDRSLGDELYSEILEPKAELDQPSVHHIKQSHSVDGEDEDWCGDGSSWNDSDGKLDLSSDLDREWQRRKNQFHAIGYRDGLIAGKEASAQEGFNIGFKESVLVGFNWGLVRGVTGALHCLPDELREKIIKSPETRNKFQHLYESVNNISTTDALKSFGDGLSQREVKQNDQTDCSVLDSCYRQLHSLIVESPALEVQSRVKTIDVSSMGKDPSLE
ncbi:hypothetical protein L1987_01125 [Smallanthus sonchifolius]|uniref:Uncharacterized protein n=1 Tax=Smallanthus sonchifolius TaxID=185202 RepID=A0ACB9K499_9ASTR|nr:hypothetical protein L1987_01125 [Smallanthus sonchifolius]